MKAGIHPELKLAKVTCTGCGNEFETLSTKESITVGICSNCHPFFTGTKKFLDTEGRLEKFQKRFKKSQEQKEKQEKQKEKQQKKRELLKKARNKEK